MDGSHPYRGLVCDFKFVRLIIESNLFFAVDSTNLKIKVLQDVSSFQIRGLCKRETDNQVEVTFFKPHLSLSDVVENVWKPAFTSWTQIVASVKDGTISLGDVDKLFDSYKNRKTELDGELSCMFEVNTGQTVSNAGELKKTFGERLAQIESYQHLHQYSSAADTVWEFKEAMGFTGDFKVIEDLRNQVS